MNFLNVSAWGRTAASLFGYVKAAPVNVDDVGFYAPCDAKFMDASAQGAGMIAGCYARSSPAVMNAAFMSVGVAPEGSGNISHSTRGDQLISPGGY